MNFLLSMSRLLSSNKQLQTVGDEVSKILHNWVGPLFIAIGGIAGVYAIILGIQYAKAESDSKRAEAKTRMWNCIFGMLCLLVIGILAISINWGSIVKIFGYAQKDYVVPDEVMIGLLK